MSQLRDTLYTVIRVNEEISVDELSAIFPHINHGWMVRLLSKLRDKGLITMQMNFTQNKRGKVTQITGKVRVLK